MKEKFRKIETELIEKYKHFNNESMFCDYTEDFFVVNWHIYMDSYINQNWIRWTIKFLKKRLKEINYNSNFFYVGHLAIKL